MEITNRGYRNIVRDAGKGAFFLAALLFIFLHVSAINAESLVCSDCHITSPHSTTGSCDEASDCTSCHVGKLATVTHPFGAGTPLDFDLSTADGRTAACRSCHGQNGHPTIGAGVDADVACGPCHGGSAGATGTSQGAPYLTLANLQIYAQVMHGQASVVGGPIPPPSVLPPGPGCDGGLTATGTLSVDSVACAADPATGLDTCNISVGKRVDISATATQTADEFVYWGDGSGIENPPVSHTYNNIGHFQVIQTVKNPCGYSAQKVMIVNVTGGSNGKGTMTITAGDATGRKISYSVMASGSLVSLTNGAITIGGYLDGSKTITLDAGTYDVKIGYSSVVPLTDPIAYHACDQDASGTLLQKCSNPSYGGQLTCEAAGAAWQTTGQLITGVVVDPNVPATVTLTNCD